MIYNYYSAETKLILILLSHGGLHSLCSIEMTVLMNTNCLWLDLELGCLTPGRHMRVNSLPKIAT